MSLFYLIRLLIVLGLLLSVISCGEDEEEDDYEEYSQTITAQGWHMQGRNCLACHNVDLGAEKHLTIGGTVYKTADVTNPDDLTQVCGGNIHVNFVDKKTGEVIVSSLDYVDPNSKGYDAKGNIFILSRKLPNLQGSFIIQIVDDKNNILAVSGEHTFETGYNNNDPTDDDNRYSCNACHSVSPKEGAPGVIYVIPQAVTLCK